jgi:hypothetical protein
MMNVAELLHSFVEDSLYENMFDLGGGGGVVVDVM